MQVRELVDLAGFLKNVIEGEKLSKLYQQLINAVEQAAQNTNPEAVATHRARLLDLHRRAAEQVLSPAQRKLLVDFGGETLLGLGAAARLTSIFEQHQAHPQGLTSALTELKNETDQLIQRANQLISTIAPMLVAVEEPELGAEEGRLWLFFAEAAAVETIEDLEKAAETWKEVLHHFSRMPNADAAPGRILAIHKYSPLEMELAASAAVLVPLALGITWVLSRVEQVIQIRVKAEELRQLKIKGEIVESLLAEAEAKRKEIASTAADDLKERFKADGDARNAAEIALRKVLAFIEGGGELDIDVPPPEPPTGAEAAETAEPGTPEEPIRVAELRELIKSMRESMKLLPPGSGEAAGGTA